MERGGGRERGGSESGKKKKADNLTWVIFHQLSEGLNLWLGSCSSE